MKLKTKYNKPQLCEVLIDQTIAVFMTSENSGPIPPSTNNAASSSSDDDSFNENKLEDNPFER